MGWLLAFATVAVALILVWVALHGALFSTLRPRPITIDPVWLARFALPLALLATIAFGIEWLRDPERGGRLAADAAWERGALPWTWSGRAWNLPTSCFVPP